MTSKLMWAAMGLLLMNSFAGCYPSGRRLRSSEPDVEPVRPVRQATAPPSPTDTSRQNSAPPSSSTDDAVTSPAEARCATFMGETVEPSDISKVLEGIVLPDPKSEFETTAEYTARTKEFRERVSVPLVIGKPHEGAEHFPYDADSQVLSISSYGFDNTLMPLSPVFDLLRDFRAAHLDESLVGHLDFAVSKQEEQTGTYAASNSYGAEATIAKMLWTYHGVYENTKYGANSLLFYSKLLDRFRLSPEAARSLKEQIGVAFVVVPKDPYVMHGRKQIHTPTVSNPLDITADVTVLVADIQCALLLDGAGKVMGAYATR